MKLPKSIQIKESVSLFSNQYKYKICIISPISSYFRRKDLQELPDIFDNLDVGSFHPRRRVTKDDVKHAIKVANILIKEENFLRRIENPFLNIYTNSAKLVESLANLDASRVKFVYMPSKNSPELTQNSIILKKLDFGFKVYLTSTRTNHENFLSWAKTNPKLRLTKSCIRDLSKERSWGGSYFYVKDDKTLTMVKMFLSDAIGKIDTVIKA